MTNFNTEYRERVGRHCQLKQYFPGPPRELHLEFPDETTKLVVIPWRNRLDSMEGVELHHICGSGNGAKRVDIETNVIMVCRSIHRWLERYKLAGFVLCCYHKQICGELDWGVLQEIKGKLMPGWLETDQIVSECQKFPWIERMRLSLLEEK